MHGSLTLLVGGTVLLGCAAAASAGSRSARVRPGVEVLLTDSAHLIRGRRLGLVTNQTGIDSRGVSDVEVLRGAGVRLVALFSPEHGFRGAADPGAAIATTIDSATGLPIYSLYGRTSAPTDSMLAGLDAIAIDLQDVGARYYTYISTAVEVMRVAGRRRLPVIILDRPNPIGGAVQGSVLDTAFTSFVGRLPVPMRHGLTMGEMARFANRELGLGAILHVVPASGWRRRAALDATGLPFVPPSPNLRSLESLFHYPGTCLFEGTTLSVGRGSDAAFEQIGSPWLDAPRIIAAMRQLRLPGVEYAPVRFTPRRPGDGKYADTSLAGIRLRVTDRSRYDPVATAVHLMAAIEAVHPDEMRWNARQFDRLAGDSGLREQLERKVDPAVIMRAWEPERRAFQAAIRPYLIYR